MRRRIDMAEVEAATKIRAKYLRALESEEWELLPGPTFVKTFLRTYADYLELDSRLLVEEYKQRFERPAGMELTPLNLRSQRRRRRVAPRIGPGVIVVVGIIVLLGVLYALGKFGEEDDEDARDEPRGHADRDAEEGQEEALQQAERVLEPVEQADAGAHLRHGAGLRLHGGLARTRRGGQADARGRASRRARSRGRRFKVTFGTAAARMRVNGKLLRRGDEPGPGRLRAAVRAQAARASPAGSRPARDRARGHRRHRHRGPVGDHRRPQRAVAVGAAAHPRASTSRT